MCPQLGTSIAYLGRPAWWGELALTAWGEKLPAWEELDLAAWVEELTARGEPLPSWEKLALFARGGVLTACGELALAAWEEHYIEHLVNLAKLYFLPFA